MDLGKFHVIGRSGSIKIEDPSKVTSAYIAHEVLKCVANDSDHVLINTNLSNMFIHICGECNPIIIHDEHIYSYGRLIKFEDSTIIIMLTSVHEEALNLMNVSDLSKDDISENIKKLSKYMSKLDDALANLHKNVAI